MGSGVIGSTIASEAIDRGSSPCSPAGSNRLLVGQKFFKLRNRVQFSVGSRSHRSMDRTLPCEGRNERSTRSGSTSGESSSGRIADLESAHLGPNPSSPASLRSSKVEHPFEKRST